MILEEMAKFIYKPNHINLLNTHITFLWFIKRKIDKNLMFYVISKKKIKYEEE